MALYDRIARTDPPTFGKINTHGLSAAMRLAASGSATISRAGIINQFNMSVVDEIELDEIIAAYGTKSNNTARLLYMAKIHDANLLAEFKQYTHAQWRTELELP